MLAAAVLLFVSIGVSVAATGAPWQNASLPVSLRVANLISLLTLEEKASLLVDSSPAIPRLGFPAYQWGRECQRGLRAVAASTPFPSGVGQASSFNASLVGEIASVTAVQARAAYNLALAANTSSGIDCFGPTINVVRDPRWGRVNEMLGGECPFLSGTLGSAFVHGLQSLRAPSPAPGEEYLGVNAVVKHLAVYGGPEGDYGDTSNVMPGMVDARYNATTVVDERLWREYYLPGWRDAAELGGASGFMASYQALALSEATAATARRLAELGVAPGGAVPDSANGLLLTDTVRGEWGMPGYVTSDAGSVLCTSTCRQSHNGGMRGHNFAANESAAAVAALTAGLDLEISCCGLNYTFPTLPASVRAGLLPESALDTALVRTLSYRFKGATLDGGADPWASLGAANLSTPASVELALAAARAGVVLLKNAGGLLPLSAPALAGRTLAVLGPVANDTLAMMGSYGNVETALTIETPFSGLRGALPGTHVQLISDPLCPNVTNCAGVSAATIAAAAAADILVVAIGASAAINSYTCAAGENYNEKEECDRHDASLPGAQLPLLQQLSALGKPLVLVLVNGGALEVDWAAASPAVRAILHAPYLGVSAGTAVAQAILGELNPAGRLTATWYSAAGLAAIGGIEEYAMRANSSSGYPGRTYRYVARAAAPSVVRYPFGFGLSYVPVSYVAASASPQAPSPCSDVQVNVTLQNAADAEAEEVVQLYLSHANASVPVPQSALVAFARVRIPPRAAVNVSLSIPPRLNALMRAGDLVEEIQPGIRTLWLGGCSDPTFPLPGVQLSFETVGPPTPLAQCTAAEARKKH